MKLEAKRTTAIAIAVVISPVIFVEYEIKCDESIRITPTKASMPNSKTSLWFGTIIKGYRFIVVKL
jgi:hypothetical protein